MKVFAITNKKTLLCEYIGLHEDQDATWWTYLGWPDPEEVERAKLKYVCEEVHCYPVAQIVRPAVGEEGNVAEKTK